MIDLNAEYKERWAEAQKEHGERLPREVVYRLQEDLRLAWVNHVKGQWKALVKVPDGKQEAEREEEANQRAPDGSEDGQPGEESGELAPDETLETTRRTKRVAKRSRPAAATGKRSRKGK